MAYTILHLSRNNQRTHLIVDDVTTLPVMFATIYGMNELSKKSLGTQENILCSLRFFYVYYYKKHKQTFDYDFYRSGYNISCFIRELDGFFTYLLGKQHLSDETDIISNGFYIRHSPEPTSPPMVTTSETLADSLSISTIDI